MRRLPRYDRWRLPLLCSPSLASAKEGLMHRVLAVVPLLALAAVLAAVWGPAPVESACCYFSAKDKDILQPAQKAFLTWDPKEKVESFTVQPKFEGNAADFGM